MTALHDFIAMSNNIERLRELLRGGENSNSQDQFGNTPLHAAVLKSERRPGETDEILQVVRELINFGADVLGVNYLNKTPLHLAVGCRNYKMIRELLLSNAQINQQDNEGCAALHIATTRRVFGRNTYDPDLGVVKLLLKFKPEVDLQNRNGTSALMLAVQNKNLPIVEELLTKKASTTLKDLNDNSAMHYALDSHRVKAQMVFVLMKHGGSLNMPDNRGRTPLTLYFLALRNAPISELEQAIVVFKLYALEGNKFNELEKWKIQQINRRMKFPLLKYVLSCVEEIKKMREDKLSPDCSVYDIARRGVYYSLAENPHFPIEAFNKALKKLINREYPIYRDIIADGICKPYINMEFSEWCNITAMGSKHLAFDVFFLVSSYLSNLDMVNMMVACTGGWRRYWYLPRFTYSTRCNIS